DFRAFLDGQLSFLEQPLHMGLGQKSVQSVVVRYQVSDDPVYLGFFHAPSHAHQPIGSTRPYRRDTHRSPSGHRFLSASRPNIYNDLAARSATLRLGAEGRIFQRLAGKRGFPALAIEAELLPLCIRTPASLPATSQGLREPKRRQIGRAHV